MKRFHWARWTLVSALAFATGMFAIALVEDVPWGRCHVETFLPSPLRGTPQHRAMLLAAEHEKIDIRHFRPYVESYPEDWIVHFVYPLDTNVFGCSRPRFGGNGPTVWVTRKPFAVTKVELSQ